MSLLIFSLQQPGNSGIDDFVLQEIRYEEVCTALQQVPTQEQQAKLLT